MNLRSGRLKGQMSREVADFTSSLEFDRRIFQADILTNRAHTTMLVEQEIIPGTIGKQILNALEQELGTAVHTWQDFGRDSDSKEAVAFALLAWQRLVRKPNTLPSATGANHSVVMGKLEL